MNDTLASFVWQYSKRDQFIILAITCLSFPLVYLSLEIPKWIINRAISGTDFPIQFFGLTLEQIPYLFVLSMLFLLMIILNNGIKFLLNMYKGVVGERMLRRLRYMLYRQILHFRPKAYERVSGDQLIPMLTSEVEDLSGYIGEAVATPAFQGGTLAVYIIFIFVQNIWLGLLAVSLYPLQAYVIPLLQGQVNRLVRQRVTNIREVAEKVGETVSGVEEIHSFDTTNFHSAQISDHLQRNFDIRLGIYRQKYFIKFLNNFLNNFPTFLFYLVGGYFAIHGDLTVGALVAVISAYSDITGPWKELLGYYQLYATNSVKYKAIVENFQPDEIYAPERLARPAELQHLSGPLVLDSIAIGAHHRGTSATPVRIEVAPGQTLAIIGDDLSGRHELIDAIAGLGNVSGTIEFAGRSVHELSEAELGRSIGRIGARTYLFNESIGANIAYALRHVPKDVGGISDAEFSRRQREARLTGNSVYDIQAVWEDLDAAGVQSREALVDRAIEILGALGMEETLFDFGMQSHIDPAEHPDLVARVLKARCQIRAQIQDNDKLRRLIELYDFSTFNDNATLAFNILFATPRDPKSSARDWASDPDVVVILADCGLVEPLLRLAADTVATLIDVLSDHDAAGLEDVHSLLTNEEIPHLSTVLDHYRQSGAAKLTPDDRDDLLGLAFRIEPARYPLIEIDAETKTKILEARRRFHERIRANGSNAHQSSRFEPLDPDGYMPSMSLAANLVEGRIRRDRANSRERVSSFIRRIIDDIGLRQPIEKIGLDYSVGVGGARLNDYQRRTIAFARTVIKRPSLLVIDDVGRGEADRIGIARKELPKAVMVLGCAETIDSLGNLDHVALLEHGCIIEDQPVSTKVPTATRTAGRVSWT